LPPNLITIIRFFYTNFFTDFSKW